MKYSPVVPNIEVDKNILKSFYQLLLSSTKLNLEMENTVEYSTAHQSQSRKVKTATLDVSTKCCLFISRHGIFSFSKFICDVVITYIQDLFTKT